MLRLEESTAADSSAERSAVMSSDICSVSPGDVAINRRKCGPLLVAGCENDSEAVERPNLLLGNRIGSGAESFRRCRWRERGSSEMPRLARRHQATRIAAFSADQRSYIRRKENDDVSR